MAFGIALGSSGFLRAGSEGLVLVVAPGAQESRLDQRTRREPNSGRIESFLRAPPKGARVLVILVAHLRWLG
jgi:hypothetical protein